MSTDNEPPPAAPSPPSPPSDDEDKVDKVDKVDKADATEYRMEHDLLGDEQVPINAYYGIQTMRAMKNFDITGVPISHFPQLIRALAMVKKASAMANLELGQLARPKAKAIVSACNEVMDGKLHEHFPVDLIQGGAGTSTNMNINEVIANRGLERMGHKKGEYHLLHPNNDINMSQSTNDVYPTAARLAIAFSDDPLIEAVGNLRDALNAKAEEFKDVLKLGRTQLQDAVPMTLGQEFRGWSATLGKDVERMHELGKLFCEVNLGGTAIGTGINTDPKYTATVIKILAEVTGMDVKTPHNMIEATSDMGDFMLFSGLLRRLAVKLSKIANDLRLLSSGPRGGFYDLRLPAMQPGSSIMPGKVNPVIPEAVNQVAFQVIGNDLTITMAAEAGQLQLNAMEPVIIYNLLSSLRMLTNACNMFTERCIKGIEANKERCEAQVYDSIGIVTAFSPFIGYEKSSEIAKKALQTGRSVVDLIQEAGWLDYAKIQMIMRKENLTGPSSLLNEHNFKGLDKSQTHLRQSTVMNMDFLGKVFSKEDAKKASGDTTYPSK